MARDGSSRATDGTLLGLDERSLGVFRIALAAVLLTDLALRARELTNHYTDLGVLPRGVLLEYDSFAWRLSLYLVPGTTVGVVVMFALHALVLLALLIGLRTRTATVLAWLFTTSLQMRNPLLLHGGDDVIRLLLFYGMFLPLGARFAVDGARVVHAPRVLTNVATVAFIGELLLIYWTAALARTDPEWWRDGTAVYYALSIDAMTTRFGLWLARTQPALLKPLTFVNLSVELIAPAFVLVPWRRGALRMVAVVAFIGLHAGFWLCLRLAIFPPVMMAAWLVILPPVFWTARPGRALARLLDALALRLTPLTGLAGQPAGHRLPPLAVAVVVATFSYALLQSVETVRGASYALPEPVRELARLARVNHNWGFFAPRPWVEDGWFVIPARLRSGAELDLLTANPVTWDKPDDVAERWGSARWTKYKARLWDAEFQRHRLPYGQWLCRTWNGTHHGEDVVETFEIFYVLEETQPPGVPAVPRPLSLWKHHCFEPTTARPGSPPVVTPTTATAG